MKKKKNVTSNVTSIVINDVNVTKIEIEIKKKRYGSKTSNGTKQGITELTWQVQTMYSITPKLVGIRYKKDEY